MFTYVITPEDEDEDEGDDGEELYAEPSLTCTPSCTGNFHFGEKPFGIPTTVGGKGLIAETEVKAKAGAAKATVRSQLGC